MKVKVKSWNAVAYWCKCSVETEQMLSDRLTPLALLATLLAAFSTQYGTSRTQTTSVVSAKATLTAAVRAARNLETVVHYVCTSLLHPYSCRRLELA